MHTRDESTAGMLPLQRWLILELLRRAGPLTIDRIPPMWPLQEADVARLVQELEAEGAVALGWDTTMPGRRTVRLRTAGIRTPVTTAAESALARAQPNVSALVAGG